MNALIFALNVYVGFMALTFILWFYYVMVMGMQAARDAGRIPADMVRLCWVIAYIGLVYDVLYNVTIGTIFFLDLPREGTLTYRLIRYKEHTNLMHADKWYKPRLVVYVINLVRLWRQTQAAWICAKLLDPFAPSGCHCTDS